MRNNIDSIDSADSADSTDVKLISELKFMQIMNLISVISITILLLGVMFDLKFTILMSFLFLISSIVSPFILSSVDLLLNLLKK